MRDTEARRPAGCTATGLLKVIALLFMFIDHSGKMVFGNATDLRLLGRIAYPIYAWCLVVGMHYTRSAPKYLLRLLLLFAVSQPLYMVALDHGWNEPNIFLTLAVSLVGLWGLRERRWGSEVWAPLLALALAQLLEVDYGWRGVLFTMLLWLARDRCSAIAAVGIAFCLYWGSTSSALGTVFGVSTAWVKDTPFSGLLTALLHMQAMSILGLIFILLPRRREDGDLRAPRWVGYAVYPAHLVVLILMECLMLSGGADKVYARLMGLVVQPVLRLFGA